MSDHQIKAAFYLSPTLDSWWRWSDDGQVLTLSDGSTIAFLPEVEEVLNRLAPQGLPPFGGLALLLAACREGWPTSVARQRIVNHGGSLGASQSSEPKAQAVFNRIAQEVDLLLKGLDVLHRLPSAQRQGPLAKALLAEVVFDGATNRSTLQEGADVVRALNEGVNPQSLRSRLSNEPSLAQFARDAEGLARGLARLDPQSLERRRQTGIDQEIRRPDKELSPPQRVRQLLAELKNDGELAGLAKLARDLMAAVTIPRTLRAREEMAMGGVSDLTNRGPLDRLVVSELAHDDLTLAVRVAVNEALYLRRETPPREPPHRRAILIDSGIRMWGVPRIFAAAAALALAATNDPKAELSTFRAMNDGVVPIDLTTRSGLDEHLGTLEPAPHPAAALQPFFEALYERDDLQSDAVLITHADVLADPEFLAALAHLDEPAIYIATVDRAGSLRLWACTRGGKKIIREAKLSLDDLLAPPKSQQKSAGVPLINKAIDTSLPAILYANPFPFYLPSSIEPKWAALSNRHGLVGATHDGRLLHWADDKHGGRQLTALLPGGRLRTIYVDDVSATATVVFLRGGQKRAEVVAANLQSGACNLVTMDLRDPDPKAIFNRRGILYALYAGRLDALDPHEGRYLASIDVPKRQTELRGAYLYHGGTFWVPSYDGFLRLDEAPLGKHAIFLFEREGHDGLWAILSDGRVSNGVDEKGLPAAARLRIPIAASADGQRLVFKLPQKSGSEYLHVDISGLPPRKSRTDCVDQEFMEPVLRWSSAWGVNLRNRYRGIFIDSTGQLSLLSKSGHVFSLRISREESPMESRTNVVPLGRALDFGPARRPPNGRFCLSVATWSDGSRAFLDSRGMLHLKGDRSMPELSFTLTNLAPAAWSSEGKVCGPKYLVGDAKQAPASHFAELLRHFVARVR
jgi:hypothetical protein